MYFNPDISEKERKRVVFDGFLGVDTASPVFDVHKKRATAMLNLININGCNHKRNGWRQIARFESTNGTALPVNGFFKFMVAGRIFQIVYAGTQFFVWDEAKKAYDNIKNVITNNVEWDRLVSRPVKMFIYADKAYFVGCGDYLMLGDFDGEIQLRKVYNDSSTYIPTTTMNISPQEIDYYETGKVVEYGARQTFRDVNLLCPRRKNLLIGSDYPHGQAESEATTCEDAYVYRTYKLDAENISLADFKMTASDYDETSGKTQKYNLVAQSSDETIENSNVLINAGDTISENKKIIFDKNITCLKNIGRVRNSQPNFVDVLTTDTVYATFHIFVEFTDETCTVGELKWCNAEGDTEHKIADVKRADATTPYYISWDDDFDGSILLETSKTTIFVQESWAMRCETITSNVVYIINPAIDATTDDENVVDDNPATAYKWGTLSLRDGIIKLRVHPHTIQGESNIEVVFTAQANDDAEYIRNATIADIFGVSGNADTLFVSGIADRPNVDFWSEATDFTYFPSGNFCVVGTSATAIKGYQRLGDDSLAILKEDSTSEPTLYIRTGTPLSIDFETFSIQSVQYFTSGRFITQGAVSSSAIAMLNGDALFLSKSGVFGIQINADSIAIEQRVAKERSRLINRLLKTHGNLDKATAIVYDNRFYLAVDDSVYIADGRYVFTQQGDMGDTFNYEWWVWDNCPVRRFYVIDNMLCFGTTDGRICVFEDGEYTDKSNERLLSAYTMDYEGNGAVVYDGSLKFKDGDLMYFSGGNAYRLIREDININGNTFFVQQNDIPKYIIGQKLLAYYENGDIKHYVTLYVEDVNRLTGEISLVNEDGSHADIDINFEVSLYGDLSDEICEVFDCTATSFRVRNRYTKEVYDLKPYGERVFDAELFKYIEENVVAQWVTPVMDFGSNDYVKQMTRFTLATEQIKNGAVRLGWETKSIDGVHEIDSRAFGALDFSNLDFDRFTFDTGFHTSFTRKTKANFNYIVFRFISDNHFDCCVQSLTIEYKVNRRNKGVF